MRAEWLIGIGDFAGKRARLLLAEIAVNKNPPLAPPERGIEPLRRFRGSPPKEGPGVGLSALGRRNLVSAEFLPREAAGQRTPSQVSVLKIGRILHPSPASPAANKDWARKATDELKALGIWT